VPRTTLNYGIGDWVSVPLDQETCAVGKIARVRPGGRIIFGYFFGPKRRALPSTDALARLRPAEAVLLARFGDLGIINGSWNVIARDHDWDPTEWPMPSFSRVDEVDGVAFKVTYSDNDPSNAIDETKITVGQAKRYPEDGLFGYKALEEKLSDLLRRTSNRSRPH
jgi:hypothetical protein